MKEISLNILDIAENSVKAGASLIEILLEETKDTLLVTVKDDGAGMLPAFLAVVTDPFTTSRTTRKVGLGIPLLKLSAEQTGGSFRIESVSEQIDPKHHGTVVTACFRTDHIDCAPLGDIVCTIQTLIQGSPQIDFDYRHTFPEGEAALDTRVLREVLEEVSLAEPEVLAWIGESLKEQYSENGCKA